jgi:hypothetical protein
VAPLLTDIQPRSEAAVHEQWLAVVTDTALVPPDAPNVRDTVDSV